MTKKLMQITVRGKEHTWSFEFYGDPQYLDEWRGDGLYVQEVVNTVPDWIPAWAIKPWCFLQDAFNFRNPLS